MDFLNYKLAIIIPSWNCSEYIGEMLNSILANSFSDWRCFVVDDCSTDDTQAIVQEFHEKDGRIVLKVRDREPKGAPTCRNIGFELTEGSDFVIWFDADDEIAAYCLEQRVAYMERHSELDFGVFPAKTFKNEVWEETDVIYGIRYGKDSLRDILKWCLPMVGWTNIYRRTSLIKYQHSWDEKLMSMQDSDFNITSILKGMTYEYAWNEGARVDYFYRVGRAQDTTVSGNIQNKKHYQSHLYLLNKIFLSLSNEQKLLYKRDLECYLYKFSRVFRNDKTLFWEFLKQPYIKSNFRLSYSLTVEYFFEKYYPFTKWKRSLIHLLMMNNLEMDWKARQREWIKFMKSNAQILRYKSTIISI